MFIFAIFYKRLQKTLCNLTDLTITQFKKNFGKRSIYMLQNDSLIP